MDPSTWSLAPAVDGRVVVRFRGHLDSEEGAISARALKEALIEPHHVVFDVREMTGYDNGARNVWVSTLLPVRRKILSLGVVGGNAIVRMGARALGLGLGIHVDVASSLDALESTSGNHAA